MGSVAAAAASSSAERGEKRRRRTLLTSAPFSCGRNRVDDAVGGTAESCCRSGGFGGTRDWSDLPEPAVLLILTALLPSLADAFSLGSVCRAWRSVFAACKRELFLALPPLLVDRGSSRLCDLGGFYALREGRFHRRRQPDIWPWMHDHDFALSDPPITVLGASHGYWVVRPEPCQRDVDGSSPVFLVDPLSPEVRIDLPQAPNRVTDAVMASPPGSPDCVVVLMDRESIWYCRPGDTQWVRHCFVEGGGHKALLPTNYSFDLDLLPGLVAVFGGKLYALRTGGKVVIVELMFLRPTVTFLETNLSPRRHSLRFLMESNGEILFVEDLGYNMKKPPKLGRRPADAAASTSSSSSSHGRLPDPCPIKHKFIVRRLDVAAREWVTLSTLGNRCLFLMRTAACVTRVAPARWGSEGDCIYTTCPSLTLPLVVFHTKDGRAEHHRIPRHYMNSCDWLTPSFCYL